ncbi:MAG: hypothetical protein ACLQBA_16460 [Candidatus Binataceae bacterium]
MSEETAGWSEEFLEALEEAISLCASRFNIGPVRKSALEAALEQVFGKPFHLGYASRK